MGVQYTNAGFNVIRSTTEPTGAIAGDLWYDTSVNVLNVYDGSNWIAMLDIENADSEVQIAQLAIQIIKLQADATLTPADYNSLFIDTFSDSTGYDNTINTGNTTAVFATNLYRNYSGGTARNTGLTYSGTAGGQTSKQGWKLTANQNTNLVSFRVATNVTATHWYIYASDTTTILSSGTLSGGYGYPNQALTNTSVYYLVVDANGGAYTQYYQTSGISKPYNLTEVTANFSMNGTFTDAGAIMYGLNDLVFSSTPANAIVQTNAITLSGNATAYMLVANKTTAGTGSVDYDIKFGAGSYQTAKTLNTRYTNTDNGNATIKINVKGAGLGNTASVYDYCLVVWY